VHFFYTVVKLRRSASGVSFGVNPSRAFAAGDEKKGFLDAVGCGMHPFWSLTDSKVTSA
jgi:hypothetical protein